MHAQSFILTHLYRKKISYYIGDVCTVCIHIALAQGGTFGIDLLVQRPKCPQNNDIVLNLVCEVAGCWPMDKMVKYDQSTIWSRGLVYIYNTFINNVMI